MYIVLYINVHSCVTLQLGLCLSASRPLGLITTALQKSDAVVKVPTDSKY